jgi:serine/threonine-protein kinase
MIGQTISHYRITEKLGEGGMGVVYKAEDTSLDRPVALKFLASHLVSDDDIRKRFEREAKAAAALNHPNICTVYEIGEADGLTFIAMAFLEGDGLDKKIESGPLNFKDALDLAIQTAKGLQAAHRKGIVHRDIKPANLMVGPDGHLTIMDFGLAQLADRSKLTRMDETMGTVTYMSPEQTYGAETDHRSDVWSLGVVIYEIVIGQQPFKGHYDKAVMYSITDEEPEPMTALRTGVPMELEILVNKCLAKQADRRYQSTADMVVDLETLSDKLKSGKSAILRTPVVTGAVVTGTHAGPTQPAGAPDAVPGPLAKYRVIEDAHETGDTIRYVAEDTELRRSVAIRVLPQSSEQQIERAQRRKQTLLLGVAALGVLLALVFAFFTWFSAAPIAEAPLRRFAFVPPEPVRVTPWRPNVAVSPDGKHVAFVAGTDGPKLWVQDLDQQQPRVIEGTAGANNPFWSPDSSFIGFAAGGELKKVSAQGGLAIRLCELPGGMSGGSWSPDGELIVFSSGIPRVLHGVSTRGGAPQVVISPDESEVPSGALRGWVVDPHFLPAQSGARVLVFSFDPLGTATLAVQDLGTGRREILGPGSQPAHSPSGHIVYQSAELVHHLWALPFSLGSLQATGEAFPVSQAGRGPTVAADGTLVYFDGAATGQHQLVWRDRGGRKTSDMSLRHDTVRYPTLSPDERMVAFSSREGSNTDVWVYDIGRGAKTRLNSAARLASFAPVAWSPTGEEVAFSFSPAGNADIFSRRADGSGEEAVLASTPQDEYLSDWSRDGKYILYNLNDPESRGDLWYQERSEEGGWEPRMFLQGSSREVGPKLSPDGRFVAYQSNESGQQEIYVLPFPEGGSKTTVSNNGGRQARWSRDGKELFYVEGGTLMAVPVESGPDFSVGAPTPLFDHPSLAAGLSIAQYDVSADGERFLLAEPVNAETQQPAIRIVQNWFEEFKDR